MATVTHRVTTPSTSNVSSYASGAFTPASGDLIVVLVTASATVATGSVSNSAGTTFTRITSAVKATSADTIYLFVANALVSSATSQTCTFDCTGDPATGAIVTVLTIAGMTRTGSGAVLKSGKQDNGAAGATPAVALGSAALTANCLVGFVGNASSPATLTQPTSWTELFDGTGYSTPTTGHEVASINSGFTGSTVTWGSTSGTDFGAIAAEFDTSIPAQTLTPGLFSNTNTFYAATLTIGTVTLSPALFSNTNTFYASSVTSIATLSPALFTNTNTFYAATATPGAVTLTPSLFSSATNTFYAATLSNGTASQNLSPSLYQNTNTFYAPSVAAGTVTVTVPLLANTQSFFAASVAVGGVTIQPTLFSNINVFFAAVISDGSVVPANDENIRMFMMRRGRR